MTWFSTGSAAATPAWRQRSRWRRAAASAVLVVVLTGCSVAVTGMASPAPAPAGQSPGTTQALPVGVDPAEIADDVRNAEEIVNAYWAKHWGEFFPGSEYKPPTVVGLYDGSKPGPDLPKCGGEPLPLDNALYCPEGDFVAWDVALMARGVVIGDGWVYLIIAHEWGHAVQARIAEAQNSQQSELQADCFAGAVLYGAANDGLLTLEEGDVREIANSLTEAADETPWTTSRDHGDPFQRIGAFDIGRRGGVAGCLPMAG